jgi:hypothetical protein
VRAGSEPEANGRSANEIPSMQQVGQLPRRQVAEPLGDVREQAGPQVAALSVARRTIAGRLGLQGAGQERAQVQALDRRGRRART